MTDIRVPHLGEGADSGTVVNILVKEGDAVRKNQTLLELENEKAVAPIPAPQEGVVLKIYVKVGDKVSVGQAIVALAGGDSGSSKTEPVVPATKASVGVPAADAERSASPGPVSSTPAAGTDYMYASKSGFAPPASPTVRKLAADLGIDLARVKGSEAGGRIVLADLRAYVQRLQSSKSPAASGGSGDAKPQRTPREKIDFSKWGPVEKKPLSSLRQKIAERMTESWTTIPHVTQFDEADITALAALRKKWVPAYEKKGARLTLTAFVIQAVVAALKKFPAVNASLDEETSELVLKRYYHIGVAVDTEAGLIVPVLRDVDRKSMLEIALELDALAERTRRRKVTVEELKGGSFTISNLGGIGGTHFTPIVNKPEVAILGVGRGMTRPVLVQKKSKSQIDSRLFLPLGLSYDHRVVDGADGARFIREVVASLETFPAEKVRI